MESSDPHEDIQVLPFWKNVGHIKILNTYIEIDIDIDIEIVFYLNKVK